MLTLLEQFIQFQHRKTLVTPNMRLGVAVSGGVDSVVLLHLLLQLAERWSLQLEVLHLNHLLRGPAAEADEKFVRKLAKDYQLPFYAEKTDVRQLATKQRLSVEAAARYCRYDFFERIAALHCMQIATAHHADDQAETLLDRILRGTGIQGLQGIQLKRPPILRPLLFATRAQIEDYAAENHLAFQQDQSNADTTFKRNRIRHELLPVLKDFNPNVVQALERLAKSASEITTVVENKANAAFAALCKHMTKDEIILEFKPFLTYLAALQHFIIRRALHEMGEDPRHLNSHTLNEFEELLCKQQPGVDIPLTPDIFLQYTGDYLALYRKLPLPEPVTVYTAGRFELWDGNLLEIKAGEPPFKRGIDSTVEWVDGDKLQEPLLVRTVKDGDYFVPINGRGRKKISDFFIDLKVPQYRRHRIPILVSADRIVWICGYRLDDRFKIRQNTQSFVKLEFRGGQKKLV